MFGSARDGREAMTMHREPRIESETGNALVTTILLLMVVSGLIAGMITSSMTDTLVSRNHHSGAQAQAAAEAGLNHAIDAARQYLRTEGPNFATTSDAVSRLLRGPDSAGATADDGSLAPDASAPAPWLSNGTPTPPQTANLAGLYNVRYEARVHDDDDPALGHAWTAAELLRLCLDLQKGLPCTNPEGNAGVADPLVDHNGYFVVRATGYAMDNTAVTVEALMKPLPWPAIVTNGNLDMAGSPQILGDGGSVHANGSITEVGNGAYVQQDVTAVGTVSTNTNWSPQYGRAEGGQLRIPIPPVNVSDYLSQAMYRLGSDGRIYNQATNTVICISNADCGVKGFAWSYGSTANWTNIDGVAIGGKWTMNGKPPNCATIVVANCGQGTYYVQGSDVDLAGTPAKWSGTPYAMTLLVEGSVHITGNPNLDAYMTAPKLQILTNGDFVMLGNAQFDGQVRVREQFELSGSMVLSGQVIVEDRPGSTCPWISGPSKVQGNATVSNDRLSVYDFGVAGWREFRR
jgi:hypothetical protein